MKCLIIAAGRGSRLSTKSKPKPLIPLLGIPIIERIIRSAYETGIDDFYVIIGYEAEKIQTFLENLAQHIGINITTILNNHWANAENGVSVLKAQDYLKEPFLLLMSDHLFDPLIVSELMTQPLRYDEINLGVDRNTTSPIIDLEDVTRVKTEGGKIQNIGKGIIDFNGFDTGIFKCTPAIFDALKTSIKENDDTTLSGGVRILAKKNRANAAEIDKRFWIDVDDPPTLRKAETTLLANLRDKQNDGPISKYLNRPLSAQISRQLVKFKITPNQISIVSFLLSLLSAGMFILANYLYLLIGGILAQFASIIDGCDGEVARLKFQTSKYGGWFDAVLDRYADAFLLFGLTLYAFNNLAENIILWFGFLAIIGSFLLSYTADKYDGLMRERINKNFRLRLGRDVRVFLIFLGAIFNQVFLVLILLAVIMNVETVRRIIICRYHE
jgi:CDP-L-myo-inositol myo-inositolphosphotransferase